HMEYIGLILNIQTLMISPSLPMTFIYGSRSNIDGQSGKAIQEMRPNSHTEIIGAGHYVFADQSDDFNQAVLKICNNVKHNGKDE
uniref:Alpha/beta hydrolase n=1 Tax=Cyprinus carpio TaxID=7962 RepID=A0A8C1YN02_CYPCA